MTTDEKRNGEHQVSRRQLLKTGVGLIGAGLSIADKPLFASERSALAPAENESMIGLKI